MAAWRSNAGRWSAAALTAAALSCLAGCTADEGGSCTSPVDCARAQVCTAESRCVDVPSCVSNDDCPAVQPCAPGRCRDGACQYDLPRACTSEEICTYQGCVSTSMDAAPPVLDAGPPLPPRDGCVAVPEVCDGADQDCDGMVDEGLVCSCEPDFGDCDGDAENQCETPLDTTLDCGRCGNACENGDACELAPTCTGGTCVRALADSSVVCRTSTCGSDPPETCDGTSTACPPACGCAGEPCCVDGCGDGLSCRDGTCVTCTTNTPVITGSFGMMGSTAFQSMSVAGGTLSIGTFTAGETGTISLGGGVTGSGSFTATSSGWLNAVSASGSTLTLTDNSGVPGTLTFSGATLSGGGTPTVLDLGMYGGILPGFISRIEGSANTLVFYDSTNVAFATVTFTGVEVCL